MQHILWLSSIVHVEIILTLIFKAEKNCTQAVAMTNVAWSIIGVHAKNSLHVNILLTIFIMLIF